MDTENNEFDVAQTIVVLNLTVAQCKRLIAKSLVQLPIVQKKMKKGMIILTRGTTNTYLAEELIGYNEPHGAFLTGHFVPDGTVSLDKHIEKKDTEIILIDGKRVDMPYEEAVKLLKEDDIVFKGANMINYKLKQAAVCIGAYDGGTTSRFLPYIGKGKAQLIIPVGMEKDTSFDLSQMDTKVTPNTMRLSFTPLLHVFENAQLYTEIEALKQNAHVRVFPNGKGGVAGREGGCSFVVSGDFQEVTKVIGADDKMEKPFHEQ